jgi:hypothetical protein
VALFAGSFHTYVEMSLCEHCQTILRIDPSNRGKDPSNSKSYGWQTAYTHVHLTLLSSASGNCYFCKQLYNDITEEQKVVLKQLSSSKIECNLFWSGPAEGYTALLFVLGEELYDCKGSPVYKYELIPINGWSFCSLL